MFFLDHFIGSGKCPQWSMSFLGFTFDEVNSTHFNILQALFLVRTVNDPRCQENQ